MVPPLIFDAPIQDMKTVKNMNCNTNLFYSLINGSNETVLPTPLAAYVSTVLRTLLLNDHQEEKSFD